MERFRRKEGTTAHSTGSRSATTTGEHDRTQVIDRDHDHNHHEGEHEREGRFERHDREHTATHTGLSAGAMSDARRRQREEFGGINWGAAFFGWLAAAGLGAILTGLVSAAGATLALGEGDVNSGAAETIGIAGGIALLVVLVVAYFAGGYVAGRMSRFDGARQGLGVWIVAVVVTLILAAAGAVLGGEYNVLSQLNLPRIPVDEGSVATGALIALAIAVIGTLLAAMAGGKAGERYHRKIDRVAVDH